MKTKILAPHELDDKQYQIYRARQQKEVDENYKVFKKHLNRLFKKHPEKFLLMKDCEMLEIFDNRADAMDEGKKRFADHVFSTHRITKEIFWLPSMSWDIK